MPTREPPPPTPVPVADPVLPRAPRVAFSSSRRFPPGPAETRVGCPLPLDCPDDEARGKIVSRNGTFGHAARKTFPVVRKSQGSPEAFYNYPDALEVLRRHKGVVTTEPRFRTQLFAGHESPGPIFNPDGPRRIPGGAVSTAARFRPVSATAGERPNAAAPSSTPGLATSASLSPSPSQQSSPGRGGASSPGRKTPSCTFGHRSTVNSPFTSGATNVHSYLADDADVPRTVAGGMLSRAERKSVYARELAQAEETPGPGHFRVESALGSKRGFHMGRRTAPPKASTPGPGEYDLRLVDQRLRRHRH